eukprot:CAMPEP_0178987506 /NCGR_PEP_ID=MMETSP0795-20121207/3302_1 /TAXON_ID=88552 /ORGANISM="Amoebophrya sp., Strain Ameob2" /LENGTH=520 /DNA_ID=CAMNT_0020678695 /DNA_START=631 /DNA_END=2193 /DNA_ORIENTATION=+
MSSQYHPVPNGSGPSTIGQAGSFQSGGSSSSSAPPSAEIPGTHGIQFGQRPPNLLNDAKRFGESFIRIVNTAAGAAGGAASTTNAGGDYSYGYGGGIMSRRLAPVVTAGIVGTSFVASTCWNDLLFCIGLLPSATVLPVSGSFPLPFFWNVVTWHFVDTFPGKLIFTAPATWWMLKELEPVFGAFPLVTHAVPNLFGVSVFAWVLRILQGSFNEPLYGTGCLITFLCCLVSSRFPQREFPLGVRTTTLPARKLPAFALAFFTAWNIVFGGAPEWFLCVLELLLTWTYLRYFALYPSGRQGDRNFKLPELFPNAFRPGLEVIAAFIYLALVRAGVNLNSSDDRDDDLEYGSELIAEVDPLAASSTAGARPPGSGSTGGSTFNTALTFGGLGTSGGEASAPSRLNQNTLYPEAGYAAYPHTSSYAPQQTTRGSGQSSSRPVFVHNSAKQPDAASTSSSSANGGGGGAPQLAGSAAAAAVDEVLDQAAASGTSTSGAGGATPAIDPAEYEKRRQAALKLLDTL